MDRTHYGIHAELEAAADEILRREVADLPRSQKMDILTPWKERDRLSREIYTGQGVPDPATRMGMYHRVWNPKHSHLNSRDGHARGGRTEELGIYISKEGYQDRAGKVYSGRIRLQSTCRLVVWGNQSRRQCIPCSRYLPNGPEVTCSRCETIYVSDEALYV